VERPAPQGKTPSLAEPLRRKEPPKKSKKAKGSGRKKRKKS
jgi:hypothetical protein